jgi:hypothetical protein
LTHDGPANMITTSSDNAARPAAKTMRVDYLAIFARAADSFCDTAAGLRRLIQVDSEITLEGEQIKHVNGAVCVVRISGGEVKGKNQRYFHLNFEWLGTPTDPTADVVDRFLRLLKAVRRAVTKGGGEIETLRDDVAAEYASVAYPIVYQVENLMRRLIASFMLTTVGREWVGENLPDEVAEAVRRSRRKEDANDYLNVLHTVDFIHLGSFLFKPYSRKSAAELYSKLEKAQSAEDLQELREFIPRSNWSRYFAGVVDCDDAFLQSRWATLYDLRCKVAHNTLISRKDVVDLERTAGEVTSKLEAALDRLSKVTVPAEEIEVVAEQAAGRVNSALGEFIAAWKDLEAAFHAAAEERGHTLAPGATVDELVHVGVLSREDAVGYSELRRFRNRVVHGPMAETSVDVLASETSRVREVHDRLERAPYLVFLASLGPDALQTELEGKIDQTQQDIINSEEFASAMADTNATGFEISDCSIGEIELGDDECRVHLTFVAKGDHDGDRMFHGDKVSGTAVAVINGYGELDYEDIIAGVEDVGGDDDDSNYEDSAEPEED